MGKKILVLHSGGMDSTVCLYEALGTSNAEVVSLGIDYGQRHSVELLFAARQCATRNIERQTIKVQWEKPSRNIPLGREVQEIKTGVSAAFLPSRNLVFLTLASAHAAGIHADELHIGINSVDFSGYPDCTPEFLDAYISVHRLAGAPDVKIVAPLLHKTKPEIARLAQSLKIGPNDTWSCYRPKIAAGAVEPCGECDACKLHEYAWRGILPKS
jgi:7-cyano-7-deazaguanine synthase